MTAPAKAQTGETTDVYVDFLCPYAWRGVEMAHVLQGQGGHFRLRHYSLVEGNHAENAKELTWRITEQPLDAEGGEGYMGYQRPSFTAFLAAHAAARQGEEPGWAYSLALFRLHHEQKKPLDDSAFEQAAHDAGLDMARWQRDLTDEQALRVELRAELDQAREVGVFGTPTFVLPTGEAAYYRFENLTRDPAVAAARWNLYQTVLHDDAGIATIKRAKNRPARKTG